MILCFRNENKPLLLFGWCLAGKLQAAMLYYVWVTEFTELPGVLGWKPSAQDVPRSAVATSMLLVALTCIAYSRNNTAPKCVAKAYLLMSRQMTIKK